MGIMVGVVEGGEGEEGGRKAEKAVGGKEREPGVPIWSKRYACASPI